MSVRTRLTAAVGAALVVTTLSLGTTTAAQGAPTGATPAAAASRCSEARAQLKKAGADLERAGQLRSQLQDAVAYWRKRKNDAKPGTPAYRTASQNLARYQGQLKQANESYRAARIRYDNARNRVQAVC